MSRPKLLLAGLLSSFILLAPAVASADVNAFVINDFHADETLSRADPQGELRIVEKLDVSFSDYNHGILRAIPTRYKGHSLQLHINSVGSDTSAPSDYSTSSSGGNTVLKIGSPNQTVTGHQQYTIDYTVRNVIGFYDNHDELYWDVNGDQWQQMFTHVSVDLHLPPGLKMSEQPRCFVGSYGTNSGDCSISAATDGLTATTTKPLLAGQTLTFVAGFPKGYFRPSKGLETVEEYQRAILSFLLPVVFIGGGSLLLWWRYGRDPKGTGIIVPHYEAPDGLDPAEVGSLIDFHVDNRDITALLIGMAVSGYIKIIETKQDRPLIKDKLTYKLQLVNNDFSRLNPSELQLLTTLYPSKLIGAEVELGKSQSKLVKAAEDLRKNIKQDLVAKGYFRQRLLVTTSLKQIFKTILVLGLQFIVFVFVIVSFAQAGGAGLVAGLVVAAIIAVPSLASLGARTAKGVSAKESIEGLKLYLDVAEKDRLNKLQGPDAQYAANAAEPVKTVDLFEKLLPYAMVLGVEQQWAKQFEGLYNTPPDWYAGNWTSFNAGYLAGSLSDGIGSAVNTAFAPESSSGSSGFGGGGFSGGGGGGGGGGGW